LVEKERYGIIIGVFMGKRHKKHKPRETAQEPAKEVFQFRLGCIKCRTPYETNDPDPYLCDPCLKERKALAEEIDKKMAGRSIEPVNNFQIMERTIGKTIPSSGGGQATFFRLSDLM